MISNNTDAVVIKKDEVIHIYWVNSAVKLTMCACILLLLLPALTPTYDVIA